MNKKSILVGALALSAFTVGSANAFTNLGTGNNIRDILTTNSSTSLFKNIADLNCGDKKADSAKTKEAKCGDKTMEAKCGDKKMGTKAKEGKCGEGNCGKKMKKAKKKAAKKATTI